MTKFTAKKLIVSLLVSAVIAVAKSQTVYAQSCETTYGGGKNCTSEKAFKVEKRVRVNGKGDWTRKILDVKSSDTVEFRVRVKNVGNVSVDKMKMEDFLPTELVKISGDLTEKWDDFDPGETKEFIIKAKVRSSEYDRDNFEKCVVNRAEAKRDGNLVGSDTATVCYGSGLAASVKELPKTGSEVNIILTMLALGSILMGVKLRKVIN